MFRLSELVSRRQRAYELRATLSRLKARYYDYERTPKFDKYQHCVQEVARAIKRLED